MLPDRVSNPGPLTYESGALQIALRGPARGGGGAVWNFFSYLSSLFLFLLPLWMWTEIYLKESH